MDRILIWLRHGEKDTKERLTERGKDQARASARILKSKKHVIGAVFFGDLPRTETSAREFADEFFGDPDHVTGPISGIGDEKMFGPFRSSDCSASIKTGKPIWDVYFSHISSGDRNMIANRAHSALIDMFEQMKGHSHRVAVAFGHHPIISIAGWKAQGNELEDQFTTLETGAALVFVKHDARNAGVVDKLDPPSIT